MTARDLAFWQAYEAIEGPIGGQGWPVEWAAESRPEEPKRQRIKRVGKKLMQLFHHPELSK